MVRDEEVLQRGVHAGWIDSEGAPTSKAFPVADLKDPARRGISVHRRSVADAPVSMRWPGHVDAQAGAVRAIRSQEGRQAFEVDAAPTVEDTGHALALCRSCQSARLA